MKEIGLGIKLTRREEVDLSFSALNHTRKRVPLSFFFLLALPKVCTRNLKSSTSFLITDAVIVTRERVEQKRVLSGTSVGNSAGPQALSEKVRCTSAISPELPRSRPARCLRRSNSPFHTREWNGLFFFFSPFLSYSMTQRNGQINRREFSTITYRRFSLPSRVNSFPVDLVGFPVRLRQNVNMHSFRIYNRKPCAWNTFLGTLTIISKYGIVQCISIYGSYKKS